jgi:hypothetical protein
MCLADRVSLLVSPGSFNGERNSQPTCIVLIVLRYWIPIDLAPVYEELLIHHGCLMSKTSTEVVQRILLLTGEFDEEQQNGK